jgi:hypothetical protein
VSRLSRDRTGYMNLLAKRKSKTKLERRKFESKSEMLTDDTLQSLVQDIPSILGQIPTIDDVSTTVDSYVIKASRGSCAAVLGTMGGL